MEVASLSYSADARPIEKVNETLEENVRVSSRAERAIQRWGSAVGDAARRVANDNVAAIASVNALDSAYRKLAGIITGLVTGAIAAFSLATFISNTSEAEKVQAQLAATLKATDYAAGQSLEALNAHAQALQNITVFGDEAIGTAQALMLTFDKVRGDNFVRATEAAADMATVMGTDVSSAAWALGRALNDPVLGMSMLRRSGVMFSASQKKVISDLVETGKTAEAQAQLLLVLETRFAGSAKAARETLGGALKSLGNAWGDAFEMSKESSDGLRTALEQLTKAVKEPAFMDFIQLIGKLLFAVMWSVVKAATALADAIKLVQDSFEDLLPVITAVGIALTVAMGRAAMASIMAGFGAMVGAVVAGLNLIKVAILANPIGMIALALAAIITAAYAFRKEISDIFGVDILGVVKTSVNYIIGSFVAAYGDIKFLWENLPDILGAAFIGTTNTIIGVVNSIVQAIATKIDWVIEKINGMMDSIPDWARPDWAGPITKFGKIETAPPAPNPYTERLASRAKDRGTQQQEELNADYLGKIADGFKKVTQATDAAKLSAKDLGTEVTESGKKAAEAYNKIIDAAEQFIQKQDLERQTLGLTAIEAARLKYEQELLNKAKEADIILTETQTNRLKDLAKQMAESENANKAAKAVNTQGKDARTFIENQLAERDALLMSADAANVYRKEREALQKATADGTVLSDADAASIRQYAREMAEAENATAKFRDIVEFTKGTFNDFLSDMIGGLRQGMSIWDAFGQAATKALNRVMDKLLAMAMDEGLSSVMGSLTSVFSSASSVGNSPTNSRAGSVEGTVQQAASNQGGLFGNLFGGGSGGGGGFLSSLFDGSAFQGAVPSQAGVMGPQMPGALNAGAGLQMGSFGMGNVMGGVSAGMGIFNAATSNGDTSKLIGGIGQAVGGALMMIPTPWTMGAGAVISLASAILPGLLGGQDQRKHASTNANLTYGAGGYYTTGGAYGENVSSTPYQNTLNSAGMTMQAVYDLAGGVKDATKVWGIALDSWTASGKDWSYTSQSTYMTSPQGNRTAWRMNTDGMVDTVSAQAALRSILEGAVGQITDSMRTAVTALMYKPMNAEATMQEVADAIMFVTDVYEDMGKKLGPAKSALGEINKTFDAMTDKAKGLNLSLDPIEAERTNQLQRYSQDFLDSMLNPFQVQLRQLADQKTEALNSAKYIAENVAGVYVDLDKITQYYTRRQLQMTQEYYEQSVGSLQDAINELTYGDLSNTSPLTKLMGLQATYAATSAQAHAGDEAARNRLAQEGMDYVAFAKTYFGSDSNSTSVKNMVRDDLANLAATIFQESGIEDLALQMQQVSTEADARNRELIAAQSEEIQKLMQAVAALTQQVKTQNVNKVM